MGRPQSTQLIHQKGESTFIELLAKWESILSCMKCTYLFGFGQLIKKRVLESTGHNTSNLLQKRI
jgi:hypothetical protein